RCIGSRMPACSCAHVTAASITPMVRSRPVRHRTRYSSIRCGFATAKSKSSPAPSRSDNPLMPKLLKQFIDAFEDRTGLIAFFDGLAKHPVPPDTGWWYVFGSATVVAFMIQVVTGMALATSYISSTGEAYDALNFITTRALFGNLLRGMH